MIYSKFFAILSSEHRKSCKPQRKRGPICPIPIYPAASGSAGSSWACRRKSWPPGSGYRSKSSITKLEKGINDLPRAKLEELAAALDTTPAWLMGLVDLPCPPPGFEPLPEMVRVPLVGSIACGTPITAEQNIECYIGVPAAWHADFALTCHGSSMAPTICDGDIVCIRRQPEVEQGEIAAVRIGEEATLKHFHRQGETVMLLADNTAVCPPMVFAGPQLEEIQIEGRAVGFCRGL